MESATESVDGPITPFKPGKDDQDLQKSQPKPSNGQEGPVKGLFASPTFDNTVANSTHTNPPARAADAQLVDAGKDRDDAANLAHIQFATPSPFPLRTKRARSATTAPQAAQLASSNSHQKLSNIEARRPEGFSPIASFPSLDPQGVPSAAEMINPKVQRDLFATVSNSQSAQVPATETSPAAAAEGTRRAKKVVTFGELVIEGLRQQHQQPRSVAADLTDDEEDEQVDLAVETPSRMTLSNKDEEWLEKMVGHYTSKVPNALR